MRRSRTIALVGSMIAFVVSVGFHELHASPRPQNAAPPSAAPPIKRVPIGYAPEPTGTPLRTRSPRTDGPGFLVAVTNNGQIEITGLGYAAIVERQSGQTPVRILESEMWSLSLKPGQTAEVSGPWLTSAEIDRLMADAAPDRIQMFLTPNRIRYFDGSEWKLTVLDPTATDHRKALGLDRDPVDIPRSMVSAVPAVGAVTFGLCRDDRNRTFSEGMRLGIRGEPGRTARCNNGKWIEQ